MICLPENCKKNKLITDWTNDSDKKIFTDLINDNILEYDKIKDEKLIKIFKKKVLIKFIKFLN